MPKKEIRHPNKEKSTGAYSAAVEVDGWVYVSGIGPVDPKTAQPVRGSVEEETLYTLTQMRRILEAAGCTLLQSVLWNDIKVEIDCVAKKL